MAPLWPGRDALKMPKLLILHDSPDYGGHEHMLLKLLPAVLDACETVFVAPAANTRLRTALAAFGPRLRVVEWPFVKRRGEPYLHRFRWHYRAAIRSLYTAERPDTVLLVQGRIENLAVPMLALPRSARIVSYVPMAHLVRDMRGGGVGDRVRRALYARPNRFIVPAAAVAAQIAAAGGRAPVTVAPNVVEPPPQTDRASARQRLGLPADKRIALYIGRLDPAQKGLDRLRAAIQRARPGSLQGWSFVFVGNGPDRAAIEALAGSGDAITDSHPPVRIDIRLVDWTERPDLFLSAADVLLLPSRWEGLPLVMLEAMHYGVPILASDIDVFRECLPPTSIVDFDRVELAEALDRVAEPAAVKRYIQHAAATLQPLTLAASQQAFADALTADASTAKAA